VGHASIFGDKSPPDIEAPSQPNIADADEEIAKDKHGKGEE
jgi:hypothetical protein